MILDFALSLRALLPTSRKRHAVGLESLPEEIIVRMVFPFLSVKDIMMLRRVNKRLFIYSKKPSVWHHQLQYFGTLKQLYAPVPPFPQYSKEKILKLPGHELERIIRTAVSYDIAWKRKIVKPWNYWSIPIMQRIEEIKLLPGGHYMVVSCRTDDGRYGISLWTVKHPATHQPAPILFRVTDVKAYGLQAKYMTIKGEVGICISLTRRWFKDEENGKETHCPEPFELGGNPDKEERSLPFKHECLVLFVKASLLEALTDRRMVPLSAEFRQRLVEIKDRLQGGDIWEVITRIRTPAQIRASSLDMIGGKPHVCILKASTRIRTPEDMQVGERWTTRKSRLEFKNLESEETSILECNNLHGTLQACKSEIWNFRILPDQGQVLVARNHEKPTDEVMMDWAEEERMTHDVVTIGIYNLPAAGGVWIEDEEQGVVYGNHVITNVQFSDPSTFKLLPNDDSLNAIIMKNNDDKPTPEPPIMCFLRTGNGFINAIIFQTVEIFVDEENRIVKHYDINNFHSTFTDAPASIKRHPTDPEHDQYLYDMVRFIPGCRRSIVYGIPYDSRSARPAILDLTPFEDLSPDKSQIIYRSDEDAIDAGNIENELFDGENLGQQVIDHAPAQIHPEGQDTTIVDTPNSLSLAFPERKSARRLKDVGQIILENKYIEQMRQRGTTMHFDEHSGMLAVATSKSRRIHFISFADIRRPDKYDDEMTMEMDQAFDLDEMRLSSSWETSIDDNDSESQ